MKGSETKLVAYMEGSRKRFVIPVYQRNYDWKIENCRQLYNDLIKVAKGKRKNHFFGSIVSVYNPDGVNDEFLIIDGQQRLTTVSLLLLAMYNFIKREVASTEKDALSERIYEEYLIDKWQDGYEKIKLRPVKSDRDAFINLFSDAAERISDSNLTINYDYFYDRLRKEEIDIKQLFDALCRFEIISITLNQDDNPQLIFESLNSTGVALSEGDKIRNFILMGLTTAEQNEYYEEYWNKIEECTGYEVSAFIRDYLSVKQHMITAQSKIYYTFKSYVEENNIETEEMLKELLAYARRYRILLNGGTGDKVVDSCIYRLNRLETTVTRPFFLEVLRLKSENRITADEVSDIFLITENYLFRRTICDLPTNALNKIFALLHRDIIRYDGTDDNYAEKFRYAVISKKERARFPDDTEFIKAFEERQIYLMNSKNKIYILERFENYGTSEDKDIYRHFDDGDYSIEHIMPQHLTPEWIKALGSDYESIHEEWLHRIANLTLTAYNSKYSNSAFSEKKNMENGFSESGIRLNSYIARNDNWALPELEKRSGHLMEKALSIWKYPATDFKPEEKQIDSYSLDEDADLSGRKVLKFSYKNTEQPVTSWIDMYERMLKILHNEDKSVLSGLAYNTDKNRELSVYFSNRQEDLRNATEIDENIYAESNTSTWLKITLLRRLFNLYGAEPSDLVFFLRDKNESDNENSDGARHELRRKYWEFALKYIKDAFGGEGPFANVNPSKDNWINGFFGVGGFYLCCVANYDSVRAELVMNKSEKEENKAAFDSLISNKAEIESRLGISLNWNRGDDIKSSKVYYQLDTGIENEINWIQAAKFHAEWSRKFYDVLVPYIKSRK